MIKPPKSCVSRHLSLLATSLGILLAGGLSYAASPYHTLMGKVFQMKQPGSMGTAFLVSHGGKQFILTNSHVCTEKDSVVIYSTNNIQPFELIHRERYKDLCIGKTESMPFHGLELSTVTPQTFDKVYTMGFPKGIFQVSEGYYLIRKRDRRNARPPYNGCKQGTFLFNPNKCLRFVWSVTTSLFTKPRASGSPVVNSEGKLVGVIKEYFIEVERGIMVDFQDVKELVENTAKGLYKNDSIGPGK